MQKTILDYLVVHRIFHYRNNVGGFKKGNHFVRFGVKGLPDIVCIVKGIYVGIEVKAINEDQSQAQVEKQFEITHAGGKYILARSLDDVIAAFA